MKPVVRYQSQLLYRRAYKPVRVIRVRPATKLSLTFRPFKLHSKRRLI